MNVIYRDSLKAETNFSAEPLISVFFHFPDHRFSLL